MDNQDDIYCMNITHQEIILDYLSDIQALMDKITLEDDNYDVFLDTITSIIEVHNEQGSYVYKDPLLRNEWFFSLPNMVYWACLGYLAGIDTSHLNMDKVIGRVAKMLLNTITKLENMALVNPSYENDKTLLN